VPPARKTSKPKPENDKVSVIKVVRAHAKAKVYDEDDDDGRWATVKTLSDEEIWRVIQGCEYDRGAIT
jgi:hypothetical protein